MLSPPIVWAVMYPHADPIPDSTFLTIFPIGVFMLFFGIVVERIQSK